jgi:hypothetical protein
MTKEAELLGKLLPALPIVEEIRKKYDFYLVTPGDDQMTEILLSYKNLDWKAIYQDINDWIRNVPDLLSPLLAYYNSIIEYDKMLTPEPIFTEPATDKLKSDVTDLYKRYVKLHNNYTIQVALPWQTAIDNTFSMMAESLFEYLLTGKTRDVPQDAISNVSVVNMFGVDLVIAMANPYANHAELAKEFLDKLNETYKEKPNITEGYLNTADHLTMKVQGMVIKDIADEEIHRHREQYPEDPESDEYKTEKRSLEDRIKTNVLRLQSAIPAILGNKET